MWMPQTQFEQCMYKCWITYLGGVCRGLPGGSSWRGHPCNSQATACRCPRFLPEILPWRDGRQEARKASPDWDTPRFEPRCQRRALHQHESLRRFQLGTSINLNPSSKLSKVVARGCSVFVATSPYAPCYALTDRSLKSPSPLVPRQPFLIDQHRHGGSYHAHPRRPRWARCRCLG